MFSGKLQEQQGNLRSAIYEVGGDLHYAVDAPDDWQQRSLQICGFCKEPWICALLI